MMEFVSNNSTSILIGSIAIIGLAFGIYFYPKAVVESTQTVVEPTIDSINHTIHHYIPSAPVTNEQFQKLLEIFKDDLIATRLLQVFQKTQFDKLCSWIFDTNLPENLKLELLADRSVLLTDWVMFEDYLKDRLPPQALIDAIANNTVSLRATYDTIINVPIPIPEITITTPIPTSSWFTSFSEFFTSEFGIKCLIVSSAVTLPIIIGHLVIKYYFKTTYKAIFIAIKKFFLKLFKI